MIKSYCTLAFRVFLGSIVFCLLSFITVAIANADTHTWDGEGGDNNWTTCANWDQSDTCPATGDTAQFDVTSSKDVTIDSATEVIGVVITSDYGGVITQSAEFTVGSGGFNQAGGTFTGGSDQIYNSTEKPPV